MGLYQSKPWSDLIWGESKPWRKPGPLDWKEKNETDLSKDIKELDKGENVQKANILLCGPNQAGKSSFMNDVIGICKGRQVQVTSAGASNAEGKTLTQKYIRVSATNAFNNFRLSDAPGLLEPANEGIRVDDVVSLVHGYIKPGYCFKDGEPIKDVDEFYNPDPTEDDKTHCLVLVFDVTMLDTVTEKYREKIREIIHAMHSEGVPYAMVLTKIDDLDAAVSLDISQIHQSKAVETALQKAKDKFGIQKRSIYPVINHVDDIDIEPLTKIPHLMAMKYILGYAKDRLEQN